jgi:hypothetical protein
MRRTVTERENQTMLRELILGYLIIQTVKWFLKNLKHIIHTLLDILWESTIKILETLVAILLQLALAITLVVAGVIGHLVAIYLFDDYLRSSCACHTKCNALVKIH